VRCALRLQVGGWFGVCARVMRRLHPKFLLTRPLAHTPNLVTLNSGKPTYLPCYRHFTPNHLFTLVNLNLEHPLASWSRPPPPDPA